MMIMMLYQEFLQSSLIQINIIHLVLLDIFYYSLLKQQF